jgi:hypothetical protein
MSKRAVLIPSLRPPPVTIHDARDVARNLAALP